MTLRGMPMVSILRISAGQVTAGSFDGILEGRE